MARDKGEQKPIDNVSQLRHAIDRGDTGDKVDNPDPALAPLGTDDEAAGRPATPAQVRMAAKHEHNAPPGPSDKSGEGWLTPAFLIGMVAMGAAIVAGAYAFN